MGPQQTPHRAQRAWTYTKSAPIRLLEICRLEGLGWCTLFPRHVYFSAHVQALGYQLMHHSHLRLCCFNNVLNEILHCQTPFNFPPMFSVCPFRVAPTRSGEVCCGPRRTFVLEGRSPNLPRFFSREVRRRMFVCSPNLHQMTML